MSRVNTTTVINVLYGGPDLNMILLWSLLITAAVAHKVVDSNEDIGPEAFANITTLYPIRNDTNQTEPRDAKKDSAKDATVWKIDATFAQSEEKHSKENTTEIVKNDTKDFRPSQHLGSYIEVEAGPTASTYDSFTPMKKPTGGFVSTGPSKDDNHSSFTKLPKEIYQTHKEYPYKFDSNIYSRTKNTWTERPELFRPGGDSLESRPTVESPVRVPAGGLYKYQDPFREKPGKEHDDNFGLEFNESGKENHLKKRGNPYQDLIRLLTAFIPVGLIISALTPSLITIEDTGPAYPYPSNVFRRSDPSYQPDFGPGYDNERHDSNRDPDFSDLPIISERCRRRLLCEIHSENNYVSRSGHRVGRQCYRIRCEDSEALARTLRWLLEYRQTHNGHT